MIFTLAYLILLFYLAIYDLKYRKIPNKIIIPAIVVTFFYSFIIQPIPIKESVIGFLFGTIIFLIGLYFDKVGGGYVKLIALVGLVEGTNIFLMLLLISLGMLLTLLIVRKTKYAVPLAPYVFGAVLMLKVGGVIL